MNYERWAARNGRNISLPNNALKPEGNVQEASSIIGARSQHSGREQSRPPSCSRARKGIAVNRASCLALKRMSVIQRAAFRIDVQSLPSPDSTLEEARALAVAAATTKLLPIGAETGRCNEPENRARAGRRWSLLSLLKVIESSSLPFPCLPNIPRSPEASPRRCPSDCSSPDQISFPSAEVNRLPVDFGLTRSRSGKRAATARTESSPEKILRKALDSIPPEAAVILRSAILFPPPSIRGVWISILRSQLLARQPLAVRRTADRKLAGL